jgi:hypothetical protein
MHPRIDDQPNGAVQLRLQAAEVAIPISAARRSE